VATTIDPFKQLLLFYESIAGSENHAATRSNILYEASESKPRVLIAVRIDQFIKSVNSDHKQPSSYQHWNMLCEEGCIHFLSCGG